MIRAVLFDLDDTLLSLNLSAFITRYVAGASHLLGEVARMSPLSLGLPYVRAFLALEDAGRTDALTNEQLFNKVIYDATGIPLDDPALRDLMTYYEREIVPGFAGGLVGARQQEGARDLVERVGELGLTCALATNPTFSLACDEARMGWAGLRTEDFALVSTYSNTTRCKPSARYYQEVADALGVRLDECLMVGNDVKRDFARPDCGLRTAYVGHARPRRAVWRGSVAELSRELPELIRRLDEKDA
ncbi:HAD family hydrolase [Olsenella sp. An290]|uniref:HAD family hydrolase n=1 Tax=Olsenella sp. An290 TaxID=1965625 RepID=UPI000B3A8164|nr:HAD family hydrolase [Olsenella sp. An290]OUO35616.1 hypothetical protein B5F84_02650 [Olsenella sp. An290]